LHLLRQLREFVRAPLVAHREIGDLVGQRSAVLARQRLAARGLL